MKYAKSLYGKLLLVSVLALSLVVASFAHRAVPVASDGATYAGIDIEAFRLPDGSLPSFCLNPDSNGSSGSGQDSCDFCTLAHGASVPVVSALPLRANLNDCAVQQIRERIAAQGIYLPGAPSTGPPVLS